MKNKIKQMVDKYLEFHEKAFIASKKGDYKTNNKNVDRAKEILIKINDNGKEAKEELASRMYSENLITAKSAAFYSLDFKENEAKKILMKISKEKGMLGFEAEQALKRWQEKPWTIEDWFK